MEHRILCMGLKRTKDDYIRFYLTLQMYIKLFAHLFEFMPHWPILTMPDCSKLCMTIMYYTQIYSNMIPYRVVIELYGSLIDYARHY